MPLRNLPLNVGRCTDRRSLLDEPYRGQPGGQHDEPDESESPRRAQALDDGRHAETDDCATNTAKGIDDAVGEASSSPEVLGWCDRDNLWTVSTFCTLPQTTVTGEILTMKQQLKKETSGSQQADKR